MKQALSIIHRSPPAGTRALPSMLQALHSISSFLCNQVSISALSPNSFLTSVAEIPPTLERVTVMMSQVLPSLGHGQVSST